MRDGWLQALLVDDEVLARLALRQALALHPDVEVVGECGNGTEALAAVPLLKPDVLFLDVQMPGMNGFEFVEALRERGAPGLAPLVVFVTAYDRHALKAFEAQAMDYLLKPLDQERVDLALAKVRAQVRGRSPVAELDPVTSGAPYLNRINVKRGDRIHLLKVDDIDWIEAEGNYVALHTEGAKYLHRETLSGLERRLDPARFVRIHRGTLVNLDRVAEIQPLFYGDAHVLLRNGTKLTMSRRYRDKAKEALRF